MGKRKMEITAVDENERTLYAMFQNTANSLSHSYSQAITHQKFAFEAGQNYAILELHEWIVEKLQERKMVTVPEILGYLQDKLSNLVADERVPEQGDSGSGQKSASAASSSAPLEQDNDPEMQMIE